MNDYPLAHKDRPSRRRRLRRLLTGLVDPRAWAHVLKIVNYYNYAHVAPLRRVRIGPGASISPNATFSNPERIEIGRRVTLGARCHLWAGPSRGRIVIGDHVLFGPDVMVTAAGYRFDDGTPITAQAMNEADVVIGDDVWIGTRAIVLPGVRIGDGAVIGAGAVVTSNIAPFAVAVGTPARAVGERRRPGMDQAADGAEPER